MWGAWGKILAQGDIDAHPESYDIFLIDVPIPYCRILLESFQRKRRNLNAKGNALCNSRALEFPILQKNCGVHLSEAWQTRRHKIS